MSNIFLSNSEVHALTNKVRHAAQARALNTMGIDYKRRPDGSIAILRSHIESVMGGSPGREAPRQEEPNWSALS